MNHYRQFLYLFAICLMASSMQAQSAFRIGVAGGAQSVWLFNADDADNSFLTRKLDIRPMFSLKFNVNITNRSAFATGIIYSLQGNTYELGEGPITTTREVQTDFVKIPLMYHYNSDIDNVVRFIFGIGPQLAFRSSTDIKVNGTNEALQYDDFYRDLDLQIAGLVGAAYSVIKELELTLAIRGDYGLLNAEDVEAPIYEDIYGVASDRPRTANSTFGVEFGVNYLIN